MTSSVARPWRSGLAVVAAALVFSVLTVEPPAAEDDAPTTAGASSTDEVSAPVAQADATPSNEAATAVATGSGRASASAAAGDAARTSGSPAGPGRSATKAAALECKAGRNGGATDKGVTAERIKLAATNVRSGTGSSFLGTSYIGMQAVVNRVNSKGGICGRLLELRLVDDGWEAARGATFIANFAKADYFALPVVPSSEGLTQAIVNKTIANAAIPVVGTDGMLKEQYSDAWVWPVATSTVSTMRIMAKHAFDNGAKTFGIVYDQQYKFGLEGFAAFERYVTELTGRPLAAKVGITPGRGSYSGEAQQFNEQCPAGGCDFVAMLLTPETATTYISSQTDTDGRRQGFGKLLTGGAQPLFNDRFGRDCGRPCEGMLVWTGYNPPIGGLAGTPDVAAYVEDVRSIDPGVDVNNQFLEGAYLGMRVLVAGLERVGPALTRDALRDVLNSMTYESTLASPLTWTPNRRFANVGAQAFKVVTASSSFAGFAEYGTGFLRDPTPGVVPE